jgi:hypothetical protein
MLAMNDSDTNRGPDTRAGVPGSGAWIESRLPVILSAMMIVGLMGFMALRGLHWGYLIFAHVGALGLLGLLGSVAGYLSREKGRGFWRGLGFGLIVPVALGLAAVAIFCVLSETHAITCGGFVGLLTAPLVIGYYAFKRKQGPLVDRVA